MRLLLLIFFSGSMYAQILGTGDEDVNVFTDSESNLAMVTFKEAIIITEGNVYLFPKWIDRARLLTKTGKNYTIIGLNYNIQSDSFEVKISKDSIFKIDSNNIKEINANGSVFKKNDIKGIDNSFVEVLYESKNISLLKKYNLRLLKGKLNPLDGSRTPDKYQIYDHFYYYQNEIIKKIRLNKKYILPLFKEKSSIIEDYVKKHKLSYKNDYDLAKMLKFYEAL